MSRVTRKKTRVSYYEPEEPSFDEYIFCSSCGDYVFEYCSIHGPLLVIPDDEAPAPAGCPPRVPRAALTLPGTFLHLAPSSVPGAGIGVFSTLTLPRGVRFGPYRGLKTDDSESPYCWQKSRNVWLRQLVTEELAVTSHNVSVLRYSEEMPPASLVQCLKGLL